ncbi:peptide chain release factor N(5)-glutamine methyltransferase [Hydrogenophaga sp. SL48]|uniref:peptide chain release factor N(5)-glutamine methyltransferase n=1 Tax=Hydrogenophaga sp. SL48 TaxID=2806347 RepID=UPI001EFF674F|nr:peptide chain release factor N(5)-glutamine methyltransferase [Hydrogenophaga sp. SL48]UJW81480.1 peptide chain release factor N(5)-glutamine methyltransferase [Hydrogenophaga sp. SL48]
MNNGLSIRESLALALQQGLDRLDAQMLLLLALGRDMNHRAWLMAHDTDPIPTDAAGRFVDLVRRRLAGEPVAYLAGEKAFFGLHLRVDARVLVPRPDTETLVQWALDALPATPARCLDLGTGSGAVALAVKSQRPDVAVTATDASTGAMAVARDNAERLGLAVDFFNGSWLQAVPGQRFDVIASNPPYIAEGDRHLVALTHEPISALTAGPDGLDDIRTIVAQAPGALHPGGWLLLEHGHDQAAAVRALLQQRGFEQVSSRTDLAGIERCSGGIWPQQR